MSQARKERFLHLVSQARSNPQLAQRVATQLPEQLRLEFLEELARPAVGPKTAKAKPRLRSGADATGTDSAANKSARPGLRKCETQQNGFSTQLNLFARSVSRVS
jgi:hypothetical protein